MEKDDNTEDTNQCLSTLQSLVASDNIIERVAGKILMGKSKTVVKDNIFTIKPTPKQEKD
jgi:hypothetical protein